MKNDISGNYYNGDQMHVEYFKDDSRIKVISIKDDKIEAYHHQNDYYFYLVYIFD